ncbi:L-fuculokinase [Naasia sp. SYSU D00057]|uniref:FGGY-family carbohydrate kinase n=1 Tax=Naasia sp. SYSU D00057 TaxID=2817380 RepID=UPI001B316EB1|nr:FGGY family carbohydrate kinase [Naasia sp. SYSU D00057]
MTSGAAGDLARPSVVALGVDIGSTNLKASLVGIGDTVTGLAVCTRPTPRDADELVRSAADLIRTVLVSAPEAPAAIGIASMAESGVPLGAGDLPLRAVLRWDGDDDPRDLDAILDGLGRDAVYAATGVPALPKAPLAQWARLRRTDPDVWAGLSRWAGVADLLGLALTGELATDHTLAARTMAYRTADGGDRFDPDLLAAVGLRPDQLPEVRRPGEAAGRITAEAASRTGLPAGVPVHIAGHDHAVGAWASGARRPGEVADSLGTAEALLRVLREPLDPERVRPTGMSLTRTVSGEPALLAGSANAGALVRWWFAHRIDAREAGDVIDEVGRLGPAPTGLLVLPYLAGRQTPQPDRRPDVRILDEDDREADPRAYPVPVLARAMLEGLALHARWMHEEQSALAGPAHPPLRILAGPGGGNEPWMRLKAQVFAAPARLTSATEPVASGAALLAASREGLLPGEPPALAGVPLPRDAGDPYQQMFERFVAAASGAALAREGER